jgi:endonuclease-3 related protein
MPLFDSPFSQFRFSLFARIAPALTCRQQQDYLDFTMPAVASAPVNHRGTLRRYYRRLYRHFGPQHWWPGRTHFEVILGALLTQNTAWTNVEKALGNLRRARALSYAGLRRLPAGRLGQLLRPAGYFRQKAGYVRGFLQHLARTHRGSLARLLRNPTAALRDELLSLPGVGKETADSILLYAANRPVFVIDAYARRILARHGLADPKARYDDLQAFFHQHLPRDPALFNEYHALLVAAGKNYCHASAPDCAACPLGLELEAPNGR